MKTYRIFSTLIIALAFMPMLQAEEPVTTAQEEQAPGKMKVFLIRGEATVTFEDGKTVPLKRGMEFIAHGSTINTKDGSAVYLIAENGTGSNIGPNSTLHVETYKQAAFDQSKGVYQLAGKNIGDSTTHLVLNRGEVASDVKSDIGLYKLETKAATADVTGSTFHTSFDPGSQPDDFVHKTLTLNKRTEDGLVTLQPSQEQFTNVQSFDALSAGGGTRSIISEESGAGGGDQSINVPPGVEITIRGKGGLDITRVDDVRLANLFRGILGTAPIYTPDNSIISPSGG